MRSNQETIMPFAVKWYQPNTIIEAKVIGVFTLAELREANKQVVALLDTASFPVYFMADASEMTAYPNVPSQIFSVATYLQHPCLAGVLVYGKPDRLMEVVFAILNRLSNVKFRSVVSRDDALAFISNRERQL
jgi:hypothetical protein